MDAFLGKIHTLLFKKWILAQEFEGVQIVEENINHVKIITDTCYLVSNNLYSACKEIRTWLMSPRGYRTLSYGDGSSFNAIVKGDIKVKVIFDTAAEITIQYEANGVI